MSTFYRNVGLLAACQALMLTSNTLIIATSALVGSMLAPGKLWATVPLALQWVGTMLTTVPAALLMQRAGRRTGLMAGALFGVAGGALCRYAIVYRRFEMFCAGSTLIGIFNAFGQQYRFAAADAAGDAFRARAISLVLAGGVVAAFAGPSLARWTVDAFPPHTFAGSYASLLLLFAASLVILAFVQIPAPPRVPRPPIGTQCAALLSQPRFVVAATSAMIGYAVMNLVMTASPLAILDCGLGFGAAALVIQWHVLAMFVPSFFTGQLVQRLGALNIIMLGAVLQLGCVFVNVLGLTVWHFSIALVLLGVGWNFMFVGATSLLTDAFAGPNKASVQGLNDFLVFSVVAVTAMSSGALHQAFGWVSINLVVVPLVTVALIMTCWLARHQSRASYA